ncbi:MAG: universal stress protein [Pseudomonadota bacterium]
MRVFMVPVANRPECVAALRATFALAHQHNACVQACHIRPHRHSTVALPTDGGFTFATTTTAKGTKAAATRAKKAAKETHEMLASVVADAGFTLVKRLAGSSRSAVVWSEQVGDPSHLMRVQGPFADLLVVSRPNSKKSHKAKAFLQAALLDSSRPVLVLPPRRVQSVAKHILIAWDRTHNAMAAVVAALPLLQQAETVTVLTSGTGKEDGPKATRLIAYLTAWGIKAKRVQIRNKNTTATDDIEAQAQQSNADLVVMGSYSRSRLRERIFGGVTERMLAGTKRPLLTIHSG